MQKNPTLRKLIRDLFRDRGLVTVVPTEKGVPQIDDFHPYFVSRTCASICNPAVPVLD